MTKGARDELLLLLQKCVNCDIILFEVIKMKIFIIFYAIALVFKFIISILVNLVKSIIGIFRKKPEEETESTVNPPIWKCFCSKCGAKGGIHRFEGKKYCFDCHYALMKEKILREHQNTNQD